MPRAAQLLFAALLPKPDFSGTEQAPSVSNLKTALTT